LFSLCDATNPSEEMDTLYGHRTAGMFGFGHVWGGYDGGQAEFVRVPFGEVNCLKVPDTLVDEQVIFLSDLLPTRWQAVEMGNVLPRQTVAVWGCGALGLMTMMWAKFRGAEKLIAIDNSQYRLNVARERFGAELINFEDQDVVKRIQEIVPGGPDVCIDCIGFRLPMSLIHKFERLFKLETDAPQALTEMIHSVQKGGTLSVVGCDYLTANHIPIGAFVQKGLTMRGGQGHVQKYWKEILEYIEKGVIDPRFIISHHLPLEDAAKAYKIFDRKEENCLKVMLKPRSVFTPLPAGTPSA